MIEEFKESPETNDFSLALGGPLYQLYLRARLARPPLELVHRRIILFIAICWLPLLVFTLLANKALSGVHVPFLKDVETQFTFLISLPLLFAADLLVHKRMQETVHHFRSQGIIANDLFGAVSGCCCDSPSMEELLCRRGSTPVTRFCPWSLSVENTHCPGGSDLVYGANTK